MTYEEGPLWVDRDCKDTWSHVNTRPKASGAEEALGNQLDGTVHSGTAASLFSQPSKCLFDGLMYEVAKEAGLEAMRGPSVMDLASPGMTWTSSQLRI